MEKKHSLELIDFLEKSPCAFLAIENVKGKLNKDGFICLDNKDVWNLQQQGKYYITRNDSALISFIIGKDANTGFKIIGSHTDSPAFMLKRNCEIKESPYLKLNTEGYGGMIMSTWLDRPLSIAGRIILKGNDMFTPIRKNIDFKQPIAIIPNLAIHLNREINNGYKYSKQKEMLPLLSLAGKDFNEKGYLYEIIADKFNVKKDDILDHELFLYEAEKGKLIGLNEEFVSASRLDDLMMVYNSMQAFLDYSSTNDYSGIKVMYLADNEEVGSKTGQGADGALLRDCLNRLCISLFKTDESFYQMIEKSIIISADLAHGLHPNYKEKHDITNKPKLGEGICLKYSASQKYSTNGVCTAIFDRLCKESNIKYQTFSNHSDMPGGNTIGSMMASQFNTNVIDFGVCVLAMHSIRELGAVNDIFDCYKMFCKFYNSRELK